MRLLRNFAIVALIAVPVAFVPGGGNAADAILTALVLGFFAAAGFAGHRLHRQSSMMLASLPDSRRGVLYGALGAIVLAIAGIDELLAEGGAGALIWVGMVAFAVIAIVGVVREATA